MWKVVISYICRCTAILQLLQASYTPLIPLMSELLSKREVKGWRMPMWNMADAATHQKLLQDAGFASVQVRSAEELLLNRGINHLEESCSVLQTPLYNLQPQPRNASLGSMSLQKLPANSIAALMRSMSRVYCLLLGDMLSTS